MNVAQTIKSSDVSICFANFIHKYIVAAWLHFVNVFHPGSGKGIFSAVCMGKRLVGKPVPIINIPIRLAHQNRFSTGLKHQTCGHRASNKAYQIARIFAINGLYIINRIRCRSPIGSSSKVAVSLGQAFMSWPPHSISIYKKRPKYFLASS